MEWLTNVYECIDLNFIKKNIIKIHFENCNLMKVFYNQNKIIIKKEIPNILIHFLFRFSIMFTR